MVDRLEVAAPSDEYHLVAHATKHTAEVAAHGAGTHNQYLHSAEYLQWAGILNSMLKHIQRGRRPQTAPSLYLSPAAGRD